MTVSDLSRRPSPIGWLGQQPYLLLSLTSLFWAGNIIVGRHLAGVVPPFTLSFVRWGGATLLILPLAWRHLAADWPAIRKQLGLMVFLSLTGIGIYNTLAYYGLQYTQALNGLLLQSAGPLFVAVWSLILLGVRLSWMQAGGIAISLVGVLTILTQGHLEALAAIQFNRGDIYFTAALAIFGIYSALSVKRPPIHNLSFLAFTVGVGALSLIPLVIWDALYERVRASGSGFGTSMRARWAASDSTLRTASSSAKRSRVISLSVRGGCTLRSCAISAVRARSYNARRASPGAPGSRPEIARAMSG